MIKKIIPIIVIVLIVAALGAGVYFTMRTETVPQNPPNLIGNRAGNLINGGLFCEADGKVYFANTYENGNLYVMNVDETEIKRINELNTFSINVAGNHLYFCQGPSRMTGEGFGLFRANTGLYRSRTNGRDLTTLKVGTVTTATVVGNEIFFMLNNERESNRPIRLFKIGIDGENERQVSNEMINPSSVADGSIYYSRPEVDHFVYAMDVRSGSSSLVFEGNTFNAIYEDGFIYYMDLDNKYRLNRYSVWGNYIEVLTDDRVDFFNVGYGVIFYQKNCRDNPALIRMDIDGFNKEVVREGNHNSIHITSRYVYFRAFGDEKTMYRSSLYGYPSVSIFRP